jgi:hypothetical protein
MFSVSRKAVVNDKMSALSAFIDWVTMVSDVAFPSSLRALGMFKSIRLNDIFLFNRDIFRQMKGDCHYHKLDSLLASF